LIGEFLTKVTNSQKDLTIGNAYKVSSRWIRTDSGLGSGIREIEVRTFYDVVSIGI
jgi:hypothetical protein